MLHLQEAVLGRDWSRTVLSNVSANELKYHGLIERLEYALHQTTKYNAASHGTTTGGNSLRTTRWKSTNFAGQGRYGNEPSSRNSIVPKYQTNRGAPRSSHNRPYPKYNWPRKRSGRSPMTCHNCGKDGCPWYKCKEPLDINRVLRNRIQTTQGSGSARTSSRVNIN